MPLVNTLRPRRRCALVVSDGVGRATAWVSVQSGFSANFALIDLRKVMLAVTAGLRCPAMVLTTPE